HHQNCKIVMEKYNEEVGEKIMNKQNSKSKLLKSTTTTTIMFLMILMIVTGSLSTSFSLHIGSASGEKIAKGILPAGNKADGNKGVFDAVSSLSFTSTSTSTSTAGSLSSTDFSLPTNENVNTLMQHQIEMQVITLPDGQPAYKIISHVVHNGSSQTDLTSRYSKLATIPGPTVVVNEGDNVEVKIKNLVHR
ncbi:MAG: Multicopper oxidase, partial [Nitrososphaeraceae archaeon]|nr:Multicopper oxidase [Nitrososphaeraceae archaeon]